MSVGGVIWKLTRLKFRPGMAGYQRDAILCEANRRRQICLSSHVEVSAHSSEALLTMKLKDDTFPLKRSFQTGFLIDTFFTPPNSTLSPNLR